MKSLKIISLATFALLLKAYVITILWLWFIAPTFHLPALSVPVAVGLSVLTSLLAKTASLRNPDDEAGNDEAEKAVRLSIGLSFMAFLIGYISSLFM